MPHFCGRTHARFEHTTSGAAVREIPQGRAVVANQPLPTHAPPLPAEKKARQVTRQQIAELAYSYWEARGRKHGSDRDDWLRAERELKRP